MIRSLLYAVTVALCACDSSGGRALDGAGGQDDLGGAEPADLTVDRDTDLASQVDLAVGVDAFGLAGDLGADLRAGDLGAGDLGAGDLGAGDLGAADLAQVGSSVDLLPSVPPSCAGLAHTCGKSGAEDCCESLSVPGGTFYRSYDGVDYTDKSYPATVSPFRLDRFEVTVERFAQFYNAYPGSKPKVGDGANPHIFNSGWPAAWSSSLPATFSDLSKAVGTNCSGATFYGNPNYDAKRPMNCVPALVAFAFCAWDGGRLPTEAEWNFAAAGGDQQRVYPWSVPATSTTVDTTYAANGGTAPDRVGKHPLGAGRWGDEDLAGNVGEFVRDWYDPYITPCVDCAKLTPGFEPAFRGGNYLFDSSYQRVSPRWNTGGSYTTPAAGIRCARD